MALDDFPPAEQGSERNPETVTLARHAESKYNELKVIIQQFETFKKFHELFKQEYYQDPKNRIPKRLDVPVLEGLWPTAELRGLALALFRDIDILMQGVSDYDTPITDNGWRQSKETGSRIADVIPKPDVIYTSPYLRPNQTLEGILQTAPAHWKSIPVFQNESIREQEHGMQTIFNDWRLHFVFEPMHMLRYHKEGEYAYRHDGGESKFDVRDRYSRFNGRLRRKHAGENVLAVTHHLTILSALAEVLHWTREDFIDWDKNRKPPNASLTLLRRELGKSRTGKDILTLDPKEYGMKLYT